MENKPVMINTSRLYQNTSYPIKVSTNKVKVVTEVALHVTKSELPGVTYHEVHTYAPMHHHEMHDTIVYLNDARDLQVIVGSILEKVFKGLGAPTLPIIALVMRNRLNKKYISVRETDEAVELSTCGMVITIKMVPTDCKPTLKNKPRFA